MKRTGVPDDHPEFRKLKTPYYCAPATERSQAIQGLRMFGPMSEESLAAHLGVGRRTLDSLRAEGLVETKDNAQGIHWWRLTPAGEVAEP